MPLEIRPLAKEDAPEAVALMVASYANNLFRSIALPNGLSQVTIEKLVVERQKAVDDPDKYALKVVDTDNDDRMAGCALWEYTKALTDEDWEHAKEEAMSEYPEARPDIVNNLRVKEHDVKRRIMDHTRWLYLNSLHTLPVYQRRGVGSMLMKWGTDKLQELKVPGFIVSTDQGLALYLKHGFNEVDRWELDLSQWPPGKGIYKNVFMTRYPSGHTSSSS